MSFSRSLKADLGTVKNLGLPDKTTAYVLAEMSEKTLESCLGRWLNCLLWDEKTGGSCLILGLGNLALFLNLLDYSHTNCGSHVPDCEASELRNLLEVLEHD